MKLKRELTLLDVFCIASGAMISSGLFVLPGIAYAKAGPAVFISYFLAALLAMTGMLSQAELASAMPKAGGTYFYVTRAMGPAVGTVDGLLTWFSLCLKSSFALVGMSAFMGLVLNIDIRIIGLILCAIFLVINIIGIKEASMLQIVLVFGMFAILIVYIVKLCAARPTSGQLRGCLWSGLKANWPIRWRRSLPERSMSSSRSLRRQRNCGD